MRRLSGRRPLVCVWQPLVYHAKSLSGDFYYRKKIEQRVCLKFCVSNGITDTESLKMLQKCFGESTLSRTQVFKWHKAFSEGLEVVENDDNIEKVEKIVLENCRVRIREVAEALNISYGSTQHIVVHVLDMKCIATRLVPKDLNFLQKERRVEVAKKMLVNVADDPTFIKRIITGDETWVYKYDAMLPDRGWNLPAPLHQFIAKKTIFQI